MTEARRCLEEGSGLRNEIAGELHIAHTTKVVLSRLDGKLAAYRARMGCSVLLCPYSLFS